MTIGDELKAFRNRHPLCRVLAFADLSTGMILASSTAEKTAQEKLDRLCEEAFHALADCAASAVAGEFSPCKDSTPNCAINAYDQTFKCFLRAPAPAQEALCLVIGAADDLFEVLSDAQCLLDRIMEVA